MNASLIRELLLAKEEEYRRDPDLSEKPVIAMRKEDMGPEQLAAVWGKNHREGGFDTPCTLCGADLFVRNLWKDNKTFVCNRCAPRFIDSLEGRAQA